MKYLSLVVAIMAVAVPIGRVRSLNEPAMEEAHEHDSAMYQDLFVIVQSCRVRVKAQMGDCLEMFREPDLNNEKYTPCKCLIFCVAEKLSMTDDNGSYDLSTVRDFASQIESDYIKKELMRVVDICETEPGTKCEGGFNIINCAVQHSHVVSRYLRMLLESLDEQYSQSTKDEGPDMSSTEAEKPSTSP